MTYGRITEKMVSEELENAEANVTRGEGVLARLDELKGRTKNGRVTLEVDTKDFGPGDAVGKVKHRVSAVLLVEWTEPCLLGILFA